MTTNRDLTATWTYHNGTKHSPQSVQRNRHSLDFDNYPLAFKIYEGLGPVALPGDFPPVLQPTLAAVAAGEMRGDAPCLSPLRTLAAILFLSGGVTKRRVFPGGELFFRAAACTGALYHIDLYLVCGDLPDLRAGVYHFGPHDFSLRLLRAGDHRGLLADASGSEPAVTHAPVTVVCTSTFWRNAWKYQARTYRHCFWDAGTVLANFLAATAALDVPARVVAGFVDREVNQLLDLDTDREVALALVPVGFVPDPVTASVPILSPLHLRTAPLSKYETDYPAIRAMHAASALRDAAEVAAWRGNTPVDPSPPPAGRVFPLAPRAMADWPDAPLDHIIRHRGSSRTFARQPITFPQLSTLLHCATRGVPADFLDPYGTTLTDLYLIVHAVEGLPAGTYVLHRGRNCLELLKEGDLRREAGFLGLGQELPADASVDIFCLADLPPVLERFGNRGYRAAQLEAAIIGGKCYLAAYGQHLGATGLTFFDDAVTAFFSPHAAGKSVMFLTAVGRPAKRQPLIQ